MAFFVSCLQARALSRWLAQGAAVPRASASCFRLGGSPFFFFCLVAPLSRLAVLA